LWFDVGVSAIAGDSLGRVSKFITAIRVTDLCENFSTPSNCE
jgi:hypothetical protein